jgi:adenylate kinase
MGFAMNVYLLLGPPGSGKSTITNRLTSQLDIEPIVTGDLLRKESSQQTKIGQLVDNNLKNGEMVPTHIVIDLISRKIKNIESKDIIFDGFPRIKKQINAFFDLGKKEGFRLSNVIVLDVSEKTILKRLSGRRICKNCGRIYNIYFDHNLKKKCNKCGGELIQRNDDKSDIIKKRIKIYRKNTYPIIEFFEKEYSHITNRINVEQTVDDILKSILDNFDL